MSEKQSVNFLRGVPPEEALSRIIPLVSEGYKEVIKRYGTDVLQYGHFTGFKILRDSIGNLHNVNAERVIVGNGGLEVISLFFKSLPRESYIIVPDHYVKHLSGIILNTRINPNLPTQAFIADFIESGRYDDNLKYLCKLYKPRMNALNSALNTMFPGTHREEITGGFFVSLNLDSVSIDNEAAFIESAKKGGVGIAAAWDAIAPNFLEEKQKKGLFFRLTFPAYQPNEIEWGISKLKESSELFG